MASLDIGSGKEIWNRVGHVEVIIWNGDSTKTYNFEGLDFKFKVSHILGRMPEGNASISICGLSQDRANEIITICNVNEAIRKPKTVKLYAGYADPENKDYKGELLATMDIINATITTPPPDIWLTITAVYSAWLNDFRVEMNIINPWIWGNGIMEQWHETQSTRAGNLIESTTNLFGKIGSIIVPPVKKALQAASKFGLQPSGDSYTISPDAIPEMQKAFRGNNMWGRLKEAAIEYYKANYSGTIYAPRNLMTVKITALMKEICDELNKLMENIQDKKGVFAYDYSSLDAIFEDGPDDTPGSTRYFKYNGSIKDLPTAISKAYKVLAMWEERNDGKIYLSAFPDPQYTDRPDARWVARRRAQKKIRFLDVNTGLIGIPKLENAINLKCRCFLDGKIQPGDYVSVKSEMMPAIYEQGEPIKINNTYLAEKWGGSRLTQMVKCFQIMKITYSGHLRGNEWFSDIEARTPYNVRNRIEDEPKPQTIRLSEDMVSKYYKGEGWDFNIDTGAVTRDGWTTY